MPYHASSGFWSRYQALPPDVRRAADRAFALLKQDPGHPSLHLKRVGPLWSAGVTQAARALGVQADDGITLIWIGSHRDYERLISRV